MVSPEKVSGVIDPTPWYVAEIIEPNELKTSGQYYAALQKAEIERYWGCLDVHGPCSNNGGYIDGGCEYSNIE